MLDNSFPWLLFIVNAFPDCREIQVLFRLTKGLGMGVRDPRLHRSPRKKGEEMEQSQEPVQMQIKHLGLRMQRLIGTGKFMGGRCNISP